MALGHIGRVGSWFAADKLPFRPDVIAAGGAR